MTHCWNAASDLNGSAARKPPIITPIREASSRSRLVHAELTGLKGRSSRNEAPRDVDGSADLAAVSPPCCRFLVGATAISSRSDNRPRRDDVRRTPTDSPSAFNTQCHSQPHRVARLAASHMPFIYIYQYPKHTRTGIIPKMIRFHRAPSKTDGSWSNLMR